ncbi:MAG: hypothetical protein HYS12_18260 [Planctomycetes bacterium]|nr:hypothetical protein [Planctomycetota bacterium]
MTVTVTITSPTNGSQVGTTFQATGTVSLNGASNMRAYLINSTGQLFYGQRLDGGTTNWAFQFTAVPPVWQHGVTLIVTGVDGTDVGSDSVDIQVVP